MEPDCHPSPPHTTNMSHLWPAECSPNWVQSELSVVLNERSTNWAQSELRTVRNEHSPSELSKSPKWAQFIQFVHRPANVTPVKFFDPDLTMVCIVAYQSLSSISPSKCRWVKSKKVVSGSLLILFFRGAFTQNSPRDPLKCSKLSPHSHFKRSAVLHNSRL